MYKYKNKYDKYAGHLYTVKQIPVYVTNVKCQIINNPTIMSGSASLNCMPSHFLEGDLSSTSLLLFQLVDFRF